MRLGIIPAKVLGNVTICPTLDKKPPNKPLSLGLFLFDEDGFGGGGMLLIEGFGNDKVCVITGLSVGVTLSEGNGGAGMGNGLAITHPC
jgi:hypothetical protein